MRSNAERHAILDLCIVTGIDRKGSTSIVRQRSEISLALYYLLLMT